MARYRRRLPLIVYSSSVLIEVGYTRSQPLSKVSGSEPQEGVWENRQVRRGGSDAGKWLAVRANSTLSHRPWRRATAAREKRRSNIDIFGSPANGVAGISFGVPSPSGADNGPCTHPRARLHEAITPDPNLIP